MLPLKFVSNYLYKIKGKMQRAEYHHFVPHKNSIPVLEECHCEGCSSVIITNLLIHGDCPTPSASWTQQKPETTGQA